MWFVLKFTIPTTSKLWLWCCSSNFHSFILVGAVRTNSSVFPLPAICTYYWVLKWLVLNFYTESLLIASLTKITLITHVGAAQTFALSTHRKFNGFFMVVTTEVYLTHFINFTISHHRQSANRSILRYFLCSDNHGSILLLCLLHMTNLKF